MPDDGGADLALLRDECRAAELALDHWAGHVLAAEREALALDGWLRILVHTLTGRREVHIEAAVARVGVARQHLDAARRRLDETRAALSWAEERDRQDEVAHLARRQELEEVALRVRASDHPLTAPLVALEAELAATRERIDVATAGFEAGSGALGAIGEVLRASGTAEGGALDAFRERPFAEVAQFVQLRSLGAALAEWREAAARLQAVVDDIGVDFVTGGSDARVPWGWFAAGDDLLSNTRQLAAIERNTDRFEDVRDEIRLLVQGFALERSRALEDLATLEARRENLLARATGQSSADGSST